MSANGSGEDFARLEQDYDVLRRILDLLGLVTEKETVDDICRTIVEGVRKELAFDRAGLHLWYEDEGIFRGTFGTDVEGRTRDEHDLWWQGDGWPAMEKIRRGDVFIAEELDQPPPRPGEESIKAHLVVLRFGDKVYGVLSVDNRISRRPIGEHELRYLTLFSRIVGNAVDLSRARARLEQSEDRFRQVAENSGEWIWETDPDGIYTFSSRVVVGILGLREEDVVGRRLLGFVHEEDRAHMQELLAQVRKSGRGMEHVRHTEVHHDGHRVVLETTALPMLSEDGGFLGFRGAHRDVTREVEREEELRKAQKLEAIGRLAGGVAHYFNNLLTCILGCSSMLMDQLEDDDPVRDDLAQITVAGEQAAKLASQLLAFSRRQMLLVRRLDLNETFMALEPLLRETLGSGIELVTRLEPALGEVDADEDQLRHAILQIVVNARGAILDAADRDTTSKGSFRRYGAGQSRLIVETANVDFNDRMCEGMEHMTPGRYVMLSLRDTGVGMSEEIRGHLFEPFYTTRDIGEGSGLGLASVYGTITQMGGDIHVESSPGEGTTFKIYLPAAVGPVAETPADRAAGRRPLKTRRGAVLLIQLDPAARRAVAHMLDVLGFAVLQAPDIRKAVAALEKKKGKLDLVIADAAVPVGGADLAGKLAERGYTGPILLVSGFGAADTVAEGGEKPPFPVIKRPFTREELDEKIRALLG